MKINKMLIVVPAMLAVVLSSCKDDDPTVGIDSSMPAPAEVSYDEMNSSSSSIGVYWDANAALKSGATSFTVQILKKKDVGGDAYDNTVSHTLQSSDSPYDASQFTGLTEGSKYFVRVRANYPRSVYSEWEYILSSYNVPAKVKVGTGVMHIDPNAKNGPEDVTVVPFFSDLNLKWEEDDTAESYVIYIDDQKVGETEELSYHVTGLDYNTSYSVSVASVYSDGSEVKADPEPTKTGNIQQITRNVGPTHLSVNWDDVSGGAGAGSRLSGRTFQGRIDGEPHLFDLLRGRSSLDQRFVRQLFLVWKREWNEPSASYVDLIRPAGTGNDLLFPREDRRKLQFPRKQGYRYDQGHKRRIGLLSRDYTPHRSRTHPCGE